MDAYLDALVQRLSQVAPCWAYLVLLGSAFLENLVPPIPGDTVVVFGAYLVGRGALRLVPVFVSTWAGGTAGFMVVYWVGATQGRALLARWPRPPLAPKSLARAEHWLARYGLLLIVVNRFLSGVRTAIALSAGIGRLAWPGVLAAAALSMALWNAVLLGMGLLLGENWAAIRQLLASYNRWVGGLVLLAVAVLLGRWWRRRRGPP